MNLKAWIYANDLTIEKFSENLGISRVYLSRIISGNLVPSKKLANEIQMATNGKIKAKTLLSNKNSKII